MFPPAPAGSTPKYPAARWTPERYAPAPVRKVDPQRSTRSQDHQQRHQQPQRGGGLYPGVWCPGGLRACSATYRHRPPYSPERQALRQAQPDQHPVAQPPPMLIVGRQQPYGERGQPHDEDGDQKVYLRPIRSPRRPNGRHRRAARNPAANASSKQKAEPLSSARKYWRARMDRQRTVEIEVIPLSTRRLVANGEAVSRAFLACHREGPMRTCHGCLLNFLYHHWQVKIFLCTHYQPRC